ncbi:uncharacterized protein N7515_001547 [Penicillium bovifimosum]|uniref:Uncharacterized protein n=1 Tax=Penicillium bovifimosum TaxID=126998 RepID=A0A9W9H9Z3_9EURO|nr:uncharacterized protein N7515_001547 [Penicillium bovifimosum]KAJ5142760.1 hypothetical protein N7515_001547 [Penicillium bovifimosum]
MVTQVCYVLKGKPVAFNPLFSTALVGDPISNLLTTKCVGRAPNTEVVRGEVLPARARLEELSGRIRIQIAMHMGTLWCQDIGSGTRNWKSRTLERLREYIVRAIETSEVNLRHIVEPNALFRHFFDNFSIEDFVHVFRWMADLLDWHRTSRMGQHFVRSVWANLATQMKLHCDIDAVPNPEQSEGDWKQIVAFWDTMGMEGPQVPKGEAVRV